MANIGLFSSNNLLVSYNFVGFVDFVKEKKMTGITFRRKPPKEFESMFSQKRAYDFYF